MEERTAVITLRIEPSLKAAFERMAKEVDQTPSQMMRGYIRHVVTEYARTHAQSNLDLTPSPPPSQPAKKPAKGQKMALALPPKRK